MECAYYVDARCRSCSELPLPYPIQLTARIDAAKNLLHAHGPWQWLPAAESVVSGFRNKAKMVVSGTRDAPQLGILDALGKGIDLSACPLYPAAIQTAFAPIAEFLARAQVQPYDVTTRSGEAKFVLLSVADHSGDLMLRLVLRSRESLDRIRKNLPILQAAIPRLQVVSVNLLPEHKAVTEGEVEIPLTTETHLRMLVNGIPLYLRPRSFFQTNTAIAAALYRQVREWAGSIQPSSIWDLYCGVGGFALHCADISAAVIGVESTAEAVESAERSRRELGLKHVRFRVADVSVPAHLADPLPQLLIVNPPRRGIGKALCTWIEQSAIPHLIYSSCNPESLARDLTLMPRLKPRQARLFDMFPHTRHAEVAVLLSAD